MIVLFAVATALMMIVFFALTLAFKEERGGRTRRYAPIGAHYAHTGLREATSLSLTRQTTWRRLFFGRCTVDERARVAPAEDGQT